MFARPFLAEYEHQEINSTSIKCKLDENLTRVSKDSLDTLYIILGSIILGAAVVFFFEFYLSKKEVKGSSKLEAESPKEKIPLDLAGLIGISKTFNNVSRKSDMLRSSNWNSFQAARSQTGTSPNGTFPQLHSASG